MPPSGFEFSEVRNLATSARSLLTRFQGEVASGKHASVEQGTQAELRTIDQELACDIPHAERGVLLFVRELYQGLQAGRTVEQIELEIIHLSTKAYGRA